MNLQVAFFGATTALYDPFYVKFLTGCVQGAGDAHRDMMISQHSDDSQGTKAFLASVRRARPGGIILIGDVPAPVYAELASRSIPNVYLGNEYVPAGTYNVAVDGEQAAELAVKYLHAAGYREILLIWPSQRPQIHSAITNGYWKAIDRLGLDAQWTQSELATAQAAKLGPAWLRPRLALDKPIALLAMNEAESISLVQALTADGIAVPQDVGVMSFGNTPLALACRPELTSVNFRMEQAGQAAVELLLRLQAGTDLPQQVMLETVLIERDSCRRPAEWPGRNASAGPSGGADGPGPALDPAGRWTRQST